MLDVLLAILPEFNDQLLHDINWHDPGTALAEGDELKEKIYLTTKENERYQCLLPEIIHDEDKHEFDAAEGASPEVLLSEVLFGETKKCSYRLEPFWTYELCHGEKVSQYHEEKDGEDGVTKTEFLLGKMSKQEVKELLSKPPSIDYTNGKRSVPFRKIDNKETPYYSVVMDNGSPCELSDKPRKTTVLYICHPTSSNEIMSVKEVTTCEYEIIVLTPTLCSNPAYMVKANPLQSIHCLALEGSPRYPLSLESHEREEITQKFIINIIPDKQNAPVKPDTTVVKPSVDISINNKFLKGEYCLIGGSGWWQYEFCHGRHVLQFHEEYGRPKTLIKLGFWDKDVHLSYMAGKKVKPKGKKHVLHFYSGGEKCDVTGKPREATVKLICKEGTGQQLSIYMTEDEICKYTVGVESPILCPLIATADQNGLFNELTPT